MLMPGWVRSANDHDRHFIGYGALIRAYGLNPADCIDGRRAWRPDTDLVELHPRSRGDYAEHLHLVSPCAG